MTVCFPDIAITTSGMRAAGPAAAGFVAAPPPSGVPPVAHAESSSTSTWLSVGIVEEVSDAPSGRPGRHALVQHHFAYSRRRSARFLEGHQRHRCVAIGFMTTDTVPLKDRLNIGRPRHGCRPRMCCGTWRKRGSRRPGVGIILATARAPGTVGILPDTLEQPRQSFTSRHWRSQLCFTRRTNSASRMTREMRGPYGEGLSAPNSSNQS